MRVLASSRVVGQENELDKIMSESIDLLQKYEQQHGDCPKTYELRKHVERLSSLRD